MACRRGGSGPPPNQSHYIESLTAPEIHDRPQRCNCQMVQVAVQLDAFDFGGTTGFKAVHTLAEGSDELIKAYQILPFSPFGNARLP